MKGYCKSIILRSKVFKPIKYNQNTNFLEFSYLGKKMVNTGKSFLINNN